MLHPYALVTSWEPDSMQDFKPVLSGAAAPEELWVSSIQLSKFHTFKLSVISIFPFNLKEGFSKLLVKAVYFT